MTASDCPHGERISPSTSTTPRRQKLNPWMSRGRELRPAWRRWVLPTSICSRMEQRMEAPREGVEVVVVFDGGGGRLRGSPSQPGDTAAPSLLRQRGCWRLSGGWGRERGMDHCCPDNGHHVPAPSPPGARGGMQSREHPKRAMGPLMATASRSDLRGSQATVDFPEMRLLTRWQGGGGGELAQERVGVDLATRMAVARRGTRRSAQLTHHRLKEVYAGGLRAEEDELTREERSCW